jgi:hypothetical protein
MTYNNDKHEALVNEGEKNLEELREERTKEALQVLFDLDYGFKYLDPSITSVLHIDVINAIIGTVNKYKKPLLESRQIVNTWLENHGEALEDEEDLGELFSDLEDPLGIEVTTEEKIDVKISATIYATRKVWVNSKTFVENVIENLYVRDITGDDVDRFDIDEIEED